MFSCRCELRALFDFYLVAYYTFVVVPVLISAIIRLRHQQMIETMSNNKKPPGGTEDPAEKSTDQEAFFQTSPDAESQTTSSQDELPNREKPKVSEDGKRILTEDDCYDVLGYSWPSWKKWMLLSSIFAVQVSMNFNTSVYPNNITPLSEHFQISEQAARVSQCVFLVLYAFGCELWAPWSEEFGRWPILQ